MHAGSKNTQKNSNGQTFWWKNEVIRKKRAEKLAVRRKMVIFAPTNLKR